MYIKRLKINNFRGIKELNWKLNKNFVCLIGPGDSTKTTILVAIEWALYPYWNINVSDYDFYDCNVENNINIEVTIGDFPEEFLKEENFGLYLRKDVDNEVDNDEPDSDNEAFLTIRLSINKYYEQEWFVINNRSEGKKISVKDRAKLSVGRIGENFYKDFNLGRNSVLKKYGDSFDELDKSLIDVYREIDNSVKDISNSTLSNIANNISTVTEEYAISPQNGFNTKIDFRNSEIGYSNINIYDGNVPLQLNGTGTKRLMSSALNINSLNPNSIVLIDEIEYGLEPYRLRKLIKNLKEKNANGQVIFTSHSPISVIEVEANDIVICRSSQGKTTCTNVPNELQDVIRAVPEALLSKKVIVTEGKTEFGLIRSLNQKWQKEDKNIEYYGVSTVEGRGGDKSCKRAEELHQLGYNVLVFIDSDVKATNIKANEISEKGIKVIQWNDNVSTEERIFLDTPKEKIQELINIGIEINSEEKIKQWINQSISINTTNYNEIESALGEDKSRKELGKISKDSGWYKRVDRGELLGDFIRENYDSFDSNKDIIKKLEKVREWAYNEI